jgi:hypothetical protein
MKLDVDSGKGIQVNGHELKLRTGGRRGRILSGLASAFAAVVLLPGMASALFVNGTATGTDGSDTFTANVQIDDAVTPGSLVFTVSVQGDNSKIKIKGFGSGLIDTANLADLTVVGDDVKKHYFGIDQAPNDDGQPPVDPSCTSCDMIVHFNKPPKGATDKSVSFTVSSLSQQPVPLSAFSNQDIAVLLQVKGAWNTRGAEKGFFFRDKKMMILEGTLGEETAIPEPTTAVMLMLGLAGLSLGERRTRVRSH